MRFNLQVSPVGLFVVLLTLCQGITQAFADTVSLTLNPTNVTGTDSSAGTVQLNIEPLGRPRTITLSSSNPNVAAVPPSVVTEFRDNNEAHFTITTSSVATATNVVITATESGVSRQAVLTVRPPSLTSISFDPDPVRGSESSVATITINRPAPANWLCSIEGPFPPIYFATGHIVSFTPGAMATTKTINTTTYPTEVDTLITVRPPTGQSPNIFATLQVVPTRVASLTLAPSSIRSGAASLGCVTLNGPAETGGATVALESSDPTVAEIPPNVFIASGDADGCFIVQSYERGGCASALIAATFGGRSELATLLVGETEQVTHNAANDRWNIRHPSTVGGGVLWTDGDAVLFNNGAVTQVVQARGDLDAVEDTVFGLGTGGSPGEVIGSWRRGQDFAWVWRSGTAPVLISAVNPIDPTQALNPAALAIADGAVFMAFQAFFDAQAVKHVFRIDPTSGVATNLSGDLAVPGASRITTSGGQAAWLFVDSANPKLQFYDGLKVNTIDSGDILETTVRLNRGRVVYEKIVAGVSHVFLFDSTLPNPEPVQLSPATDATHGHFAPATDGYHVAWLFGLADRTDLDVLLNGGLPLNDAASRAITALGNSEFPLQLRRGQLLWKGADAALRYAAGGEIETLCLTPAESFAAPWLADGFVAGFGPVQGSIETDNEVFLYPGLEPNDADRPLPPILVVPTPEKESVVLEWDRILGASSYNVYLAEQPGVTRKNHALLPGGRRLSDIPSRSTRVCGLADDATYFVVVTAVENDQEGGESTEISVSPEADWTADSGDVLGVIRCLSGPSGTAAPPGCEELAFAAADFTCDGDVDLADVARVSNFLIQ